MASSRSPHLKCLFYRTKMFSSEQNLDFIEQKSLLQNKTSICKIKIKLSIKVLLMKIK